MKKTELIIPFTKKLAEAAGLAKETEKGERFFRCLRMPGYFPPKGDLESFAERLCKLLLEKHEEALLYTENGLRRVLEDFSAAEEILEKLSSSWEEDAPDAYAVVSRSDDEWTVLFGYEDGVEAVLCEKGRTVRIGADEPER